MAIALFGGSFDPPHTGHLAVVNEALKMLPIERLVIVPAYVNPFKSGTHAPAKLRLEWLRRIFADETHIEVSDYEIAQGQSVPTIKTVQHYRKKYDRIYLIIGADNLATLSKWYRFDELDPLVTWVVATRDEQKVDEHFLTLNVKEPVSSTTLRQEMQTDLIPEKVADEIAEFYKEQYAKTH